MGRANVTALLLERGADPDADADRFSLLALCRAQQRRMGLSGRFFSTVLGRTSVSIRRNPPPWRLPALFCKARRRSRLQRTSTTDTVRMLVDMADPVIPTERGTTPLMLAAGAGTDLARPRSPEERAMALQTVRFLIERGADVNAAGLIG